MDLLITVSNPASGDILESLLEACVRRQCRWQVFITHRAVAVLQQPRVAEMLQAQGEFAVVCHDSWSRYAPADLKCPITLGSQTQHSEMLGCSARVISL